MSDEEAEELLRRLRPILVRLRQDGIESVEMALDSFEADMGGVLKLQVPCRSRKRTIPEAAFQTERYVDIP